MWRSHSPMICLTSVECSIKLIKHTKMRTLLNSVRFFRAGKMQRKRGMRRKNHREIIPIELSTTMSVMMGQM